MFQHVSRCFTLFQDVSSCFKKRKNHDDPMVSHHKSFRISDLAGFDRGEVIQAAEGQDVRIEFFSKGGTASGW